MRGKVEAIIHCIKKFQMNPAESIEFGTQGTRKRKSEVFLAQSNCGAILLPVYMQIASYLAQESTATLASMRTFAQKWRLPGAIKVRSVREAIDAASSGRHNPRDLMSQESVEANENYSDDETDDRKQEGGADGDWESEQEKQGGADNNPGDLMSQESVEANENYSEDGTDDKKQEGGADGDGESEQKAQGGAHSEGGADNDGESKQKGGVDGDRERGQETQGGGHSVQIRDRYHYERYPADSLIKRCFPALSIKKAEALVTDIAKIYEDALPSERQATDGRWVIARHPKAAIFCAAILADILQVSLNSMVTVSNMQPPKIVVIGGGFDQEQMVKLKIFSALLQADRQHCGWLGKLEIKSYDTDKAAVLYSNNCKVANLKSSTKDASTLTAADFAGVSVIESSIHGAPSLLAYLLLVAVAADVKYVIFDYHTFMPFVKAVLDQKNICTVSRVIRSSIPDGLRSFSKEQLCKSESWCQDNVKELLVLSIKELTKTLTPPDKKANRDLCLRKVAAVYITWLYNAAINPTIEVRGSKGAAFATTLANPPDLFAREAPKILMVDLQNAVIKRGEAPEQACQVSENSCVVGYYGLALSYSNRWAFCYWIENCHTVLFCAPFAKVAEYTAAGCHHWHA